MCAFHKNLIALGVDMYLFQLGLKKVTIDETGDLICPTCGDAYLHQYRVDVFERDEDCIGLHTRVERKLVTVDDNVKNNPSPRRQGLVVSLWCENCRANVELSILQHKGGTQIGIASKGVVDESRTRGY